MSKRSINRRQQRTVKKIQARHIEDALQENNHLASDDLSHQQLGRAQQGLVVAHYGKHVTIQSNDNHLFQCAIRQNLGDVAAGDQVIWQPENADTGIIVAVLERTSAFGRPGKDGCIKAIAANIDQLLIVVAPQPALILTLLDSYLVTAETLNMTALIILNKVDLISEQTDSTLLTTLKTYQDIGYQVVHTSCLQQDIRDTLQSYLGNKSSVFVGQSGVGKSSLIAKLIPDRAIRIGTLSGGDKVGKHTTSHSYLYQLAQGGQIIDSPGIRALRLWHMDPQMIAAGFVEFQPYLNNCKFRNCQHLHEPDCALKQAVAQGKVAAIRLENFHKLILEI